MSRRTSSCAHAGDSSSSPLGGLRLRRAGRRSLRTSAEGRTPRGLRLEVKNEPNEIRRSSTSRGDELLRGQRRIPRRLARLPRPGRHAPASGPRRQWIEQDAEADDDLNRNQMKTKIAKSRSVRSTTIQELELTLIRDAWTPATSAGTIMAIRECSHGCVFPAFSKSRRRSACHQTPQASTPSSQTKPGSALE